MLTLETNVLLGNTLLEQYIALNGYEAGIVADISHSIISTLAQDKNLDTDFLEWYISLYKRTLRGLLLFKGKRDKFNDFLELVKTYNTYRTKENAQAILDF